MRRGVFRRSPVLQAQVRGAPSAGVGPGWRSLARGTPFGEASGGPRRERFPFARQPGMGALRRSPVRWRSGVLGRGRQPGAHQRAHPLRPVRRHRAQAQRHHHLPRQAHPRPHPNPPAHEVALESEAAAQPGMFAPAEPLRTRACRPNPRWAQRIEMRSIALGQGLRCGGRTPATR